MKKSLILLALLAAAPLAQAQDITYALPSTTVSIKVEVRQENFFAGPYAAYAHRLLNMDVQDQDAVTCTLLSAELIPSIEADTQAWYTCEADNATLLTLSAQGLIAFPDQARAQSVRWRFPVPEKADYTRSGLTSPEKEVTRIEYKTVQTDTALISIPVEHRVLVDKTPEDKAADAAALILSVRQDRLNIASGNTDATYSGAAMGEALKELDGIEKEYLSLFRGYSVTRILTATFDVCPSASDPVQRYLAFRLTDDGPVADGYKGVPYYLELEPETLIIPEESADRRKGKGNPVHYRVPAICKVRLTADGRPLLETRLPIYQLGKELTVNLNK